MPPKTFDAATKRYAAKALFLPSAGMSLLAQTRAIPGQGFPPLSVEEALGLRSLSLDSGDSKIQPISTLFARGEAAEDSCERKVATKLLPAHHLPEWAHRTSWQA